MTRPHPPAARHGEITEPFPEVFFVQGTVRMPGPPAVFSRNMTILRHEGKLCLLNSVRLSEAGLAALDALGEVTHVIRLAAFHGLDDRFYKERSGAEVWAVEGSSYGAGFSTDPAKAYFQPDRWMTKDTELPIPGARMIVIESATPREGLVLLERDEGILISGDALQNWGRRDEYMNFLGWAMMKVLGFIKPHNIGPGWIKEAKPDPAEVRGLLDLPFEHVLPAHGAIVRGDARAKYRPAIDRLG